jgi:hypothetical protein
VNDVWITARERIAGLSVPAIVISFRPVGSLPATLALASRASPATRASGPAHFWKAGDHMATEKRPCRLTPEMRARGLASKLREHAARRKKLLPLVLAQLRRVPDLHASCQTVAAEVKCNANGLKQIFNRRRLADPDFERDYREARAEGMARTLSMRDLADLLGVKWYQVKYALKGRYLGLEPIAILPSPAGGTRFPHPTQTQIAAMKVSLSTKHPKPTGSQPLAPDPDLLSTSDFCKALGTTPEILYSLRNKGLWDQAPEVKANTGREAIWSLKLGKERAPARILGGFYGKRPPARYDAPPDYADQKTHGFPRGPYVLVAPEHFDRGDHRKLLIRGIRDGCELLSRKPNGQLRTLHGFSLEGGRWWYVHEAEAKSAIESKQKILEQRNLRELDGEPHEFDQPPSGYRTIREFVREQAEERGEPLDEKELNRRACRLRKLAQLAKITVKLLTRLTDSGPEGHALRKLKHFAQKDLRLLDETEGATSRSSVRARAKAVTKQPSKGGRPPTKNEEKLDRFMKEWERVKKDYRGRGGLGLFSIEKTRNKETLPNYQKALRQRRVDAKRNSARNPST